MMPNREGCFLTLAVTIGAWWLIAAYWPDSFLAVIAIALLLAAIVYREAH